MAVDCQLVGTRARRGYGVFREMRHPDAHPAYHGTALGAHAATVIAPIAVSEHGDGLRDRLELPQHRLGADVARVDDGVDVRKRVEHRIRQPAVRV